MATLRERKNGTWEIQFWNEYRQRKTITLSGRKFKRPTAERLRDVVKVLVDKKINDDPTKHKPTQEWIENAVPDIREKLSRFDLWQGVSTRHTAKELWDTFLDQYGFQTESTQETFRNARDRFFPFFKPTDLIVKLTRERVEEWKQSLLASGYAKATVAGTIRKTKTVFNWAKKQKWITDSPLAGFAEGSYRNPAKDRVVTMEEYHKLLAACPDQEWRVIIALARIGGLRPCEIMVLRWSDIGVGKGNKRFNVFSPKLNPHEHLRWREVPLFPLLLSELNQLRSIPGNEGQEFVINRFSNRENLNLVQPFTRIAERAGIGRIVRPFDNMRASRSTEVHRDYGAIAESKWLGHSKEVAKECYLMVTDDDFNAAFEGKSVQSTDEVATVPFPGVTQVAS
jgi:integrase